VPRDEWIDGLHVTHPRVLFVPKIGHAVAGATYAASLLPYILRERGKVDVVLGSFAYPDGWAAVVAGRMLRVPTVIKVHGGDVNVLSHSRIVRPHLRWALSRAEAVVATSRPLARASIAAGANPSTTTVVMNGVDTDTFRVRDRDACRRELGQPRDGRSILYVGRLETRKGALEMMQAFARIAPQHPDARLVMVGDGTERGACERMAQELGLRVLFAGARPHAQVGSWLGACNLLCLPSHAEGTPNVVLEALASGRRVVATHVGGIPDVVDRPELGELVPPKDVGALAGALARALVHDYVGEDVAKSVSFGGWNDSAGALHDVLRGAIERHNMRS
jgi:glycosyltransferase involved in cell wall biosynthesis